MKSLTEKLKRAAAVAAVSEVEDGMTLGLGSGTTIDHVLDEIARRIHEDGLRVRGIPTSNRTHERASALGIPLTDFSEITELDLAIDGADEVLFDHRVLIKGLGGALLRERIVAAAAQRFLVVVDESKITDQFSAVAPVPVEVVRFGHEATAGRLARQGLRPVLRTDASGEVVVTDGGNLLYDCHNVDSRVDPSNLAGRLRQIVGVIDSGIFIGMATDIVIALSPTDIRHVRTGAPLSAQKCEAKEIAECHSI